MSEQEVLQQAKAYCEAMGHDFDEIYFHAYPDEEIPDVENVSLTWLFDRIIEGLEEVNYHGLADHMELECAQ